jgi:hypothetical protein
MMCASYIIFPLSVSFFLLSFPAHLCVILPHGLKSTGKQEEDREKQEKIKKKLSA